MTQVALHCGAPEETQPDTCLQTTDTISTMLVLKHAFPLYPRTFSFSLCFVLLSRLWQTFNHWYNAEFLKICIQKARSETVNNFNIYILMDWNTAIRQIIDYPHWVSLVSVIQGTGRPECCNQSSVIKTLRPRQTDAISQTPFSNAFSWMNMFEFRLKCHWNLFPRVQFTIFQQWFR